MGSTSRAVKRLLGVQSRDALKPGEESLRMLMAWTFLYAASHQVFVPGWKIPSFRDGEALHPLVA
jgi:hypothetical protein